MVVWFSDVGPVPKSCCLQMYVSVAKRKMLEC